LRNPIGFSKQEKFFQGGGGGSGSFYCSQKKDAVEGCNGGELMVASVQERERGNVHERATEEHCVRCMSREGAEGKYPLF